jgi:hypothetical protein
MDRRDFDALTRLVASTHSRRTALTALVGGVLFGHDPNSAEAAQEVAAERQRRRNRDRDRKQNCRPAGGFPSSRRPCCSGLKIDADGRCSSCKSCAAGQRCVGNQCQCDGQSCPSGCCTASGSRSGTCQQGNVASECGTGGGACLTCSGTTPICTGSRCVCDAAARSCVNGCCDGVTCQPGTAHEACGAKGQACSACSGAQVCEPLASAGGGGACV